MYTTISYRFPGESSIEDLGMSEGAKSKSISTSVNWVAFKQQFFSSAFIAPQNVTNANLAFDTAAPGSELLKSFSAQMAVPYTVQTEGYDFAFYFGPNKYAILKKVAAADGEELHMERLIPLGWGIFGWVNRWCVIPVFDFLRNYIGSFGIIILILVILVKLVISPLTYKSYVSMAKMRLIKPQVDELNKKYPKKEDAMKKQQATMELYKKAGINPMGGCIPMLIQMPILIAMFRFFPASIELREQPFLWADDLSSYDSIVNLPFSIPFYGDHVSLFALLMAVSLFGYSYFNYQQTASSQPQMAGMKFMMVYMMPIMMLLWFNSYSSGLCYYYLLSNLFTIGQTFAHPPHGRRREDPCRHAGQCRQTEVEGQEVEVPAALRGAPAPAGGAAAYQTQVNGSHRRRAGSGDCRIRRRPMREARWPARFREARRYAI